MRIASKKRMWLAALLVAGSVMLVCAILGGVFAWRELAVIKRTLPDVRQLENYELSLPSQIYSADGEVIGELFSEKRYPVKLGAMSPLLVKAFLASEDSEFYRHSGLDYMGILRAGLHFVFGFGSKTGGSTITQQLAKTVLLTREQTVLRKLKDMLLARQIESMMPKDRILELYLNAIFLGNNSHGVEAASRNYFRKSCAELSLAEAAMIAGLAPAPSKYAPTTNFKAAKNRQKYVLSRMVELNMISEQEALAAYSVELNPLRAESPNANVAPFFFMEVKKILETVFEPHQLEGGGFKIYTTIDLGLQKQALNQVRNHLKEHDSKKGFKGPISRHGEILEDALSKMIARPVDLETEALRAIVVDLLPQMDAALIVSQLGLGMLLAEDHRWALRTGKNKESDVLDFAHILRIGDEIHVKMLDRGTPRRIRENASQLIGMNKYLPYFLNGTSYEGIRYYALSDVEQVEASVLLMDVETGGVRVMIGGSDFESSQFNRSVLAKRQVGSSIKPLYFGLALDHGFGAASQIDSPPIVIGDWKPENYSRKFLGRTTLRSSLIHSYNIPSIQLFQALGMDLVAAHMQRLGIDWNARDLSLALGSGGATLLEMVQAYTPFANSGMLKEARYIDRIEDRTGKILIDADDRRLFPDPVDLPVAPSDSLGKEATEGVADISPAAHSESSPLRVLSPEAAYIAYSLLEGVVNFGTGTRAQIPSVRVAGKTGTTNGYTDAWFLGMAPGVVCGAWVGFDDARKSLGTDGTGGKMAAPLWREVVRSALVKYGKSLAPPPPSIRFVSVDAETGDPVRAGGVSVPAVSGAEPGSGGLRHALGMYGLDGVGAGRRDRNGAPDEVPNLQGEDSSQSLRSFF
jgi:penicillin-binding protein 1A